METTIIKKNGKASNGEISNFKPTVSIRAAVKNGEKPSLEKPVETPQKEVKQEVEKVDIPQPEKPTLTLDQKIEKVQNLKTLIEKREKLEESRKKLGSFVVGSNQFSENIILTDENGNKFQTSNSEVFTKVVKTINETLVEKISEIEKQIEF